MPDLAWFHLLWFVPVVGAVVTRFAPRQAADALAVGTAVLAAVLAADFVGQAGVAGAAVPLAGLAAVDRAFGHPVGLFGFRLDALASLVLLGNALIGVACVLYSTAYVGSRNREMPSSDDRRTFFFWLLLFIGAMSGLVTSATLVQLFLFWEITTICSCVLGTFLCIGVGNPRRSRSCSRRT